MECQEFWHHHLAAKLTGPFIAISHTFAKCKIFISQIYNTVLFIFMLFILCTTSGRKASICNCQSLWAVVDHLAKSDSMRLKGGRKGSYAQEKGWKRRMAIRKNDAALMKEEGHSMQWNRRWNNKMYYANRRDQGLLLLCSPGELSLLELKEGTWCSQDWPLPLPNRFSSFPSDVSMMDIRNPAQGWKGK